MWKLLHRLFGWDYVTIPYGRGDLVRRVQHTTTGRPFVRAYGAFVWLNDGGTTRCGRVYMPLTWDFEQSSDTAGDKNE